MKAEDNIKVIKGVGDVAAERFFRLGIRTVEELLSHYPKEYEVYEMPRPIKEVKEGELVSVQASVYGMTEIKRMRNLHILTCTAKDPSGSIGLTWFNQQYLKSVLTKAYRFVFRGRAVRKNGVLVLEQPKIFKQEEYQRLLNVLQPVYPLTEGLTNNAVSKCMKQVLSSLDLSEDILPSRIRKEYNFILKKYALHEIHFPKSLDTMLEARKRLVFEEFFKFLLMIRHLNEHRTQIKNKLILAETKECEELIASLPYSLTTAQKKVWGEISADLRKDYAMNRLVQGDVGSGKTILALLALLMTAKNGCQGCLMVPTEVLAKQHYEELIRLLTPFGIRIQLLTGSMKTAEKRKAYARIEGHETDIIIGTHALIQEKVVYAKLALVITDEQHRFGVKQRESLANKGECPHVLVMSATPIPRTLAIILYGDLDISVLDEMPKNRLPIKNCVVNTGYRSKAYQFIKNQIESGRQAYIICPMVEESEAIEAENVIEYAARLTEVFRETISVEYLHGKMKPKEKNEIMERFSEGKIQVLVSTTVVEVGINVPNATVMMIENAERFGLASLHQLRGRVGRGKEQSYCILVCGSTSENTIKRLSILNQSNDGFFIAGEDLKLRGPGDLFGIRQSGEMEFKLGDIYHDASVLSAANECVNSLTESEYAKLNLTFNTFLSDSFIV